MIEQVARRRAGRGLVLALLVIVTASCGPNGELPLPIGGADPLEPEPPQLPAPAAGEDFYRPAQAIPPGDPGRVVRTQPIETPAGVRGWRVLYHSRAVDGRGVVVSGLVFAPGAAAEPGSRAVVSWGHGSAGLGDRCSPSLFPEMLLRQPVFLELIARGFVVAASDYEGLGTPGPHPWLVGLSEGRGMLDIVRAAARMPETGAGNRFVAFGVSQGGGASLFAGELAEEYAPELDLLGVVAAAPAAELDLLVQLPRENLVGASGFMIMGAFGFAAAYPDLVLEDILHPGLIAARSAIENMCQFEVESLYRSVPLDQVLIAPPSSVDAWAAAITENTPGRRATPAPVLMFHGSADRVIPVDIGRLLFRRLCDVGVATQFEVYEGVDHAGIIGASAPRVLDWIDARAGGSSPEPAENALACP